MQEKETKTGFTTAPDAYDYGYVEREVTDRTYARRPVAKVTMPVESWQYQTDRYASGMYVTVAESELDPA